MHQFPFSLSLPLSLLFSLIAHNLTLFLLSLFIVSLLLSFNLCLYSPFFKCLRAFPISLVFGPFTSIFVFYHSCVTLLIYLSLSFLFFLYFSLSSPPSHRSSLTCFLSNYFAFNKISQKLSLFSLKFIFSLILFSLSIFYISVQVFTHSFLL